MVPKIVGDFLIYFDFMYLAKIEEIMKLGLTFSFLM
jgi:hypothetical protein